MSTITSHTTRAAGTILTAAVYNADHVNHITNALALNTDKLEGATPPVGDGHGVLFDGVTGAALKSLGAPSVSSARQIIAGTGLTGGGDLTANRTLTLAVPANTITNAMLVNMATQTVKGRTTAGAGAPEDLTPAQATAILDAFTSALKGLVPPSGGGTANFLRADGNWASPAPTAGSGITVAGTAVSMAAVATRGGIGSYHHVTFVVNTGVGGTSTVPEFAGTWRNESTQNADGTSQYFGIRIS